jgi:hypothetical protein
MPKRKKSSKSDQRKRLNLGAWRCGISVADLKKRLKSDRDSTADYSQQDVLVSHDTSNENSPSTVEEQGDAVTRGVQAVLQDGVSHVAQVTAMQAQHLEAEERANEFFAQLTATQSLFGSSFDTTAMARIAQALQEEAREEVGREGAGEGAQDRGSQSLMRAARRNESTQGVHKDTGVFSPPWATGDARGGVRGVARGGEARGRRGLEAAREGAHGRGSQSLMLAARGSESTQGVHIDTGIFSPPCAREGTRGGAARGGARGGARGRRRGSGSSVRGSSRGGVHTDTGVFSPP